MTTNRPQSYTGTTKSFFVDAKFLFIPPKKGKNIDVQLLDVKNTVERNDHVIFHDQYLIELIHLFQLSRNSEI